MVDLIKEIREIIISNIVLIGQIPAPTLHESARTEVFWNACPTPRPITARLLISTSPPASSGAARTGPGHRLWWPIWIRSWERKLTTIMLDCQKHHHRTGHSWIIP
ncbi:MAG: hypothetical protein R2874_06290 [Desulfobacterales bacterium]